MHVTHSEIQLMHIYMLMILRSDFIIVAPQSSCKSTMSWIWGQYDKIRGFILK